jgi:hypothetical protein
MRVDAGPGVTVGWVQVWSSTTASAMLTADTDAPPGPRLITVTVGIQEYTMPNGIRVH